MNARAKNIGWRIDYFLVSAGLQESIWYFRLSPDGRFVLFNVIQQLDSYVKVLDLETGVAKRLTDGQHVDSRPRWSPAGDRLAFVRDFGNDTGVVVLTVESGEEQIINTPAVDLDPEFSADGQSIYYANAVTGSLDLWRHHLAYGF